MDKELEDKILNQLSDDDRNLIHEQYVRRNVKRFSNTKLVEEIGRLNVMDVLAEKGYLQEDGIKYEIEYALEFVKKEILKRMGEK